MTEQGHVECKKVGSCSDVWKDSTERICRDDSNQRQNWQARRWTTGVQVSSLYMSKLVARAIWEFPWLNAMSSNKIMRTRKRGADLLTSATVTAGYLWTLNMDLRNLCWRHAFVIGDARLATARTIIWKRESNSTFIKGVEHGVTEHKIKLEYKCNFDVGFSSYSSALQLDSLVRTGLWFVL